MPRTAANRMLSAYSETEVSSPGRSFTRNLFSRKKWEGGTCPSLGIRFLKIHCTCASTNACSIFITLILYIK